MYVPQMEKLTEILRNLNHHNFISSFCYPSELIDMSEEEVKEKVEANVGTKKKTKKTGAAARKRYMDTTIEKGCDGIFFKNDIVLKKRLERKADKSAEPNENED